MKVRKSGNRPKLFTIESLQNDAVLIELRYASSGIQTSAPLVAIVHYFAQEFSFKDAFQRSVLNYLYKQDLLTKFTRESTEQIGKVCPYPYRRSRT